MHNSCISNVYGLTHYTAIHTENIQVLRNKQKHVQHVGKFIFQLSSIKQNVPELKKILGQSLNGQDLILQYRDRPQRDQQMPQGPYYSALIPDPGRS